MKNKELADLFGKMADILEFKGENLLNKSEKEMQAMEEVRVAPFFLPSCFFSVSLGLWGSF